MKSTASQTSRMLPKARLILVRHGETVGNSSSRYFGRTDLELAPAGIEQMKAVARLLAGVEFRVVCSSPLKRALQSAQVITQGKSIIQTLDDFAEIDFGIFEGLTAEEIRLLYPEHFEQWSKFRFHSDYTYPQGESRAAFTSRVLRGLQRVFELWITECNQEIQGNALIVAHRGVVRTITKQLAGLEPVVELGSVQVLALTDRWQAEVVDWLG